MTLVNRKTSMTTVNRFEWCFEYIFKQIPRSFSKFLESFLLEITYLKVTISIVFYDELTDDKFVWNISSFKGTKLVTKI